VRDARALTHRPTTAKSPGHVPRPAAASIAAFKLPAGYGLAGNVGDHRHPWPAISCERLSLSWHALRGTWPQTMSRILVRVPALTVSEPLTGESTTLGHGLFHPLRGGSINRGGRPGIAEKKRKNKPYRWYQAVYLQTQLAGKILGRPLCRFSDGIVTQGRPASLVILHRVTRHPTRALEKLHPAAG